MIGARLQVLGTRYYWPGTTKQLISQFLTFDPLETTPETTPETTRGPPSEALGFSALGPGAQAQSPTDEDPRASGEPEKVLGSSWESFSEAASKGSKVRYSFPGTRH